MLSPQCITLPNNPIFKNPRHQNKKYEIKIKNIFFTVKTNTLYVYLTLHFGNALKKCNFFYFKLIFIYVFQIILMC